jgi:hypothetical protein
MKKIICFILGHKNNIEIISMNFMEVLMVCQRCRESKVIPIKPVHF